MRAASVLFAAVLLIVSCDQPQTEAANRRRAIANVRRDSTIPPDVIVPFVPPRSWDTVRLTSGVQYRQPSGFALGLNDNNVGGCNAGTLPADAPIFHTAFGQRWPLTLAMRRGDLSRLARVNGFVLDSTIISTQGQRDSDSTRVRRGEGWLLLSGRAWQRDEPIDVLFGALRYPGGCYLVLAARGVDISVDTLGYVLSTVKFPAGAP